MLLVMDTSNTLRRSSRRAQGSVPEALPVTTIANTGTNEMDMDTGYESTPEEYLERLASEAENRAAPELRSHPITQGEGDSLVVVCGR